MGNTAIHCESLGKRYRLGVRKTLNLREALMKGLTAPLQRHPKPPAGGNGDATVWALRDVSFSIGEGEVVGIIGRNGAGKSTLLKVLSRITEPTTGKAEVRGRVGSLLEVGTGFHAELTGRENIFLNGAILGMKKAEITRKFEEIVAFAEIEKFLDTPVKHYSSGMYVRLAFAVAAHLDPEILLVDEVLAVGDAPFQKKCFERVRAVGRSGRTILFISHNMAALRQVCRRGMVLERGEIVAAGPIDEVVDKYLGSLESATGATVESETTSCVLHGVSVRAADGTVVKPLEPAEVRVRFTAKTDLEDPGIYVCFQTLDGERLAGLRSRDFIAAGRIRAGERVEIGFTFEKFPFLPGAYNLELHFQDPVAEKYEIVPQVFRFEVAQAVIYGSRHPDVWSGRVALAAKAFCAPLDVRTADRN